MSTWVRTYICIYAHMRVHKYIRELFRCLLLLLYHFPHFLPHVLLYFQAEAYFVGDDVCELQRNGLIPELERKLSALKAVIQQVCSGVM